MSSKLRIGITCYPSTGGSGILATELGKELARRGHEVHFISHGLPFRLDVSQPNVYFHEVVVNSYELFKYPDYTLPLAVKMAEVSQRYALDILHVHYAVPHATAAYLTKQILSRDPRQRPRVITTLHGTDITLLGQDANYMPIIKYSIEHSCGVTAVSESLKRETLHLLDVQKDIEVIYNFVPLKKATKTRQQVREELGIGPEVPVIIHISNLRPVKRIPDLLKIIATSKNKTRLKLLILAGSGFTPFQKMVDELDLQDQVVIREQVLDIENYLPAADIGLYTSEKESFGLGILESMQAGHPVLGSRAGGIPEVVVDGTTGFLFDVGDVTGFANGLDYLLAHPPLMQEMGEAGKKRANEVFSSERIVTQYEQFYDTVLSTCA